MNTISKPTPKPIPHVQGEYLRFIRDHFKEKKIPPSLGELVAASGDTKSTVRTTIRTLMVKGYVEKLPQRTRNLRVTDAGLSVLRRAR